MFYLKESNMKKVTKEQLKDTILNGEDISKVDYSEITDISFMFNGCKNLKEIPHLDTSKVTDMSSMFYGCTNLKEIPHLDTSNVTDIYEMFSGCINLEYLKCPEDFNSRYFSKEQNPLIYKNYLEMFL